MEGEKSKIGQDPKSLALNLLGETNLLICFQQKFKQRKIKKGQFYLEKYHLKGPECYQTSETILPSSNIKQKQCNNFKNTPIPAGKMYYPGHYPGKMYHVEEWL